MDQEAGGIGGGGEGEEEWGGVAGDGGRRALEGEGAKAGDAGDGVGRDEAVDVDELAGLDGVSVAVREGEGDVGGVEGVGKLEVEAGGRRPEVGGGGGDAGDLKDRGAMLGGENLGGVGRRGGGHGLEELEEGAGGY